jgi:hypothetical protein
MRFVNDDRPETEKCALWGIARFTVPSTSPASAPAVSGHCMFEHLVTDPLRNMTRYQRSIRWLITRLVDLVAALVSIASSALAEEQSPLFRRAFSCPDRGKGSICAASPENSSSLRNLRRLPRPGPYGGILDGTAYSSDLGLVRVQRSIRCRFSREP